MCVFWHARFYLVLNVCLECILCSCPSCPRVIGVWLLSFNRIKQHKFRRLVLFAISITPQISAAWSFPKCWQLNWIYQFCFSFFSFSSYWSILKSLIIFIWGVLPAYSVLFSIKRQATLSVFWMESGAVTRHYSSERCSVEFFHVRVIWSVDSGKVLSSSSGLLDRTLVCIVLIVSS